LIALAGLVLSPAVGLAGSAKLPFKPGHYVGYTNQTCPAEPMPMGLCRTGETLPISFTVTTKSVSDLKAVVVDKCRGELHSLVHAVGSPPQGFVLTPRKGEVIAPPGKKQALVEITQHIEEAGGDTGAGSDSLYGHLRGTAASGKLSSSILVNADAQPDYHGESDCTAEAHWNVTRRS
jgi:hypothetical protein